MTEENENFECIEEFWVDNCDDDGGFGDGGQTLIKKGSVWQKSEPFLLYPLNDPEGVRLDCEGRWMEIDIETFKKHFKATN